MQLANAVVPLFEHAVDSIVAAVPDAQSPLWDASGFRQHNFAARRAARSIVFKWLDNNWRPGRPYIVVAADGLPAELTKVVSACAGALERRFDGRIAKLMLAELAPGGAIAPHRDRGSALVLGHRCHLPVLTNADVSFYVDGEDFKLQPGTVYEFDNTRIHAVANRGDCRRVHLICDIMPSSYVS